MNFKAAFATTFQAQKAIDLRNTSDDAKSLLNDFLVKKKFVRREAGKLHAITDKAWEFWNAENEVIGLEFMGTQLKTVRKNKKLDCPKVPTYTVAQFVETI